MALDKKRIFVDAHMLDYGFEGTASFIQGLYMELLNMHPEEYQIYLGCLHPERVLKLFDRHPAIKTIPYRTKNRYLRLLVDIPLITHQLRPDFAHFQHFTPLIKNCPWHVTIHDVLFNDFPEYFPSGYANIRNLFFPLSANRADLLSTVSKYSRDRLIWWYKCTNITIIPNGSSKMEVDGLNPSSKDVAQVLSNPAGYLLCVSRFEPRKNQASLLKAFATSSCPSKGIELVFVGSRTLDVAEFDYAWNETPKNVKAQVKFLSDLPYSDIQLLNAKARASVYPSFAEGFGMPPLESAIHGTPSLCANTTSMSEFDFLKPFFFNPSDILDIRRCIDRVVEHPEEAAKQMNAAKEAVRTGYSWSRSAEILHHTMRNFSGNK